MENVGPNLEDLMDTLVPTSDNLMKKNPVENAIPTMDDLVKDIVSTSDDPMENMVSSLEDPLGNVVFTSEDTVQNAASTSEDLMKNIVSPSEDPVGNIGSTSEDLVENMMSTSEDLVSTSREPDRVTIVVVTNKALVADLLFSEKVLFTFTIGSSDSGKSCRKHPKTGRKHCNLREGCIFDLSSK